MSSRVALVLGGSGYVGQEVVRGLAREGVRVAFTYHTQSDVARELEAETGARSFATNLAEPKEIRELFGNIETAVGIPDILVHTAVRACRAGTLDVSDELADEMYAVNVRSILVSLQCLFSRLSGRPADIVLTSSQAGIAHVPASPAFAATQAARLGLTHSLAKELGPKKVRINLVVLGLLAGGISAEIDPSLRSEYEKFSAFSRLGTAAEAAQAIVRFALTNQWMSGSIVPLTGGL